VQPFDEELDEWSAQRLWHTFVDLLAGDTSIVLVTSWVAEEVLHVG
jgi:hypothetical protein